LGRLKCNGSVYLVTKKVCVKFGNVPHEAETMKFIADNTSIPVPRVICSFKRGTKYVTVMERVQGTYLGWALYGEGCTEERREKLLKQLKIMFDEMRALPPPGPGVSSATGGPIYNWHLDYRNPIGPFENVAAFHKWLRLNDTTLPRPEHVELVEDAQKVAEWHKTVDDAQPVFSHGDLHQGNILVDGDKITAIIDWETAGWLPPYWDYAQIRNIPLNCQWRVEDVDRVLEPFPEAAKIDGMRRACWFDSVF
jgi:aminoglycoside phosphotransferase (APT) family kinase protein